MQITSLKANAVRDLVNCACSLISFLLWLPYLTSTLRALVFVLFFPHYHPARMMIYEPTFNGMGAFDEFRTRSWQSFVVVFSICSTMFVISGLRPVPFSGCFVSDERFLGQIYSRRLRCAFRLNRPVMVGVH